MKSSLTKQLLTCFIISSMLLQFVVSAADFHLHTLSDDTHNHVHEVSNTHIVINIENYNNNLCSVVSPSNTIIDLYDHHCCHSVSTSVTLSIITTPLLPKQSTTIALYSVDFYISPISDSLIRPPIT